MDYQTRKEAEEEMERRDQGYQRRRWKDHYADEGEYLLCVFYYHRQ